MSFLLLSGARASLITVCAAPVRKSDPQQAASNLVRSMTAGLPLTAFNDLLARCLSRKFKGGREEILPWRGRLCYKRD
jgi:hypothetical protein